MKSPKLKVNINEQSLIRETRVDLLRELLPLAHDGLFSAAIEQMIEEESKLYTPKELAAEIGIPPKKLRRYLRARYPRSLGTKGKRWAITKRVADDARKNLAPPPPKEPKADAV